MNPRLSLLQPYPFEQLRILLEGIPPSAPVIDMTIGEPQHATPEVITQAIQENLHLLGKYPPTPGTPALREAIAGWISRRFGVSVDPSRQIIPVSGSREALFSFAQAVIDPTDPGVVLLPNPFYQIYEGASLLAGARPEFVSSSASGPPDWASIPGEVWPQVKLAYVCSPGNPEGYCFSEADWKEIFAYADRYGFIVAADEPYSEIYNTPDGPIGALTVAKDVSFERLVVFNSLSKRSSAPGLRSGFVAGNAEIIQKYLLYRTYHGAAPSNLTQMASEAAWNDEAHVVENRRLYQEKFAIANQTRFSNQPDGGFFLWSKIDPEFGTDDEAYAKNAFRETGVKVLPGSYLAREHRGVNPGKGKVRIALVQDAATIERGLCALSELA